MMKYEVESVKPSLLPIYLKTIVKRSLNIPGNIKSGRPFPRIALTPREIVGAFLVFAVGQFLDPDNVWTIGSDPESQDGVICCVDGPKKGDYLALEQVYVPSFEQGDLSHLIQKKIKEKSTLGSNYAIGRHLVVFCDRDANLDFSKVSYYLESQNEFLSYWIIARVDKSKWNYLVATPKTSGDPCLAYKVLIADDFDNWTVEILGQL